MFDESRPVDIRQVRILMAILLGCTCVVLALPRASPADVRFVAFAAGGCVGTLLYAPLQRVRRRPKYALTIGMTGTLVAIAIVGALARWHASPTGIALAVLLGFVSLGAVLLADRMRTLWRESLD